MKDIILKAMENCALRYAKGFPRWKNLWDEKLTVQQKSIEISDELESLGYVLLKRVSIDVNDDLGVFNNTNGE
jgi:hypothetical protein